MKNSTLIIFTAALLALSLQAVSAIGKETDMQKVQKTDEQWKQELTPEEYHIMREKGTERPFTGKFCHFKGKGIYKCASCGAELFDSDTKFDSGSGWPSFWAPVQKNAVAENHDASHGMQRTEIICPICGGHLGHVFDDGPNPTGKRYCVNSASLKFEEKK